MYNVKLKQHAGKTTEPFYKTICCRVVLSDTKVRGNVGCVYVCRVLCLYTVMVCVSSVFKWIGKLPIFYISTCF